MKKKISLSKGIAALGAALALTLTACGGNSGEEGSAGSTMRLGMVAANDSVQHKAAQMFAEKVTEYTDGALKINVFPAGQIGSDEALGQDMSRGDLEFGFINQGSMAGMDQLLDFHYLPYIVTNYAQADELYFGDGVIPTTMTETLAKHDIRALGWVELEFRGLSNSKSEVTTPDQVQGLKVRVPGSAAINSLFQTLGAQPVTVPFPELYTALQQKTVDGQENGLIITTDNRFQEVNKFYTMTRHVYATGTIAISEKTWQALPAEQQEAVQRAADEASEWEVAEERKLTETVIEKARGEGVTVTELSDEQLAAFVAEGQKVWTEMESVYGKDKIDALRAEVDAVQGLS